MKIITLMICLLFSSGVHAQENLTGVLEKVDKIFENEVKENKKHKRKADFTIVSYKRLNDWAFEVVLNGSGEADFPYRKLAVNVGLTNFKYNDRIYMDLTSLGNNAILTGTDKKPGKKFYMNKVAESWKINFINTEIEHRYDLETTLNQWHKLVKEDVVKYDRNVDDWVKQKKTGGGGDGTLEAILYLAIAAALIVFGTNL